MVLYEIVSMSTPGKLISQGSYGDIWADSSPDVAIKEICSRNIESIVKEIIFADLCSHENIISYDEIKIITDDEGYIRSVRLYMRRYAMALNTLIFVNQTKLPPADMAQIGRCIAAGLAHMHSRGIIHRDIKPGNILIDTSYGQIRALICDFGISGAMSENNRDKHVITAPYRPPELARAGYEQKYDYKVDIWSFGCVLYELVTGQCWIKSDKIDYYCPVTLVEACCENFNIEFKDRVESLQDLYDLSIDYIQEHISQLIKKYIPEETYQQLCELGIIKSIIMCLQPNPEKRCNALDVLRWLGGGDSYNERGCDTVAKRLPPAKDIVKPLLDTSKDFARDVFDDEHYRLADHIYDIFVRADMCSPQYSRLLLAESAMYIALCLFDGEGRLSYRFRNEERKSAVLWLITHHRKLLA